MFVRLKAVEHIITMRSSRKRFFQCFRSVFYPLFTTGCLSFSLNAQQKLEISILTVLSTNLGRLIALGSFITGCVYKIHSQRYSETVLNLSPLTQLLGLVELVISLVTYCNVSISMEFNKKSHAELFNKAYELDKILIEDFEVSFNYDEDIRKHRNNARGLMLYCGVYYTISIISLDFDLGVVLLAFGYAMCTVGPLASSYAHVCLIDFLRVRFEMFQSVFKKYLSVDLKHEEEKRKCIVMLMNHFRKYCELIHAVNDVYGYPAMVNYLHDFTQTSCVAFVLCHMALESEAPAMEYLFLFVFALPRMLKIVYMAAHARITILELQNCFQVIKTYDDHCPLEHSKQHIENLIMWNRLNDFQFNVGSALRLNFGLVYEFFLGVGNYVLIFIQLKFQEASIKDRLGAAVKKEYKYVHR